MKRTLVSARICLNPLLILLALALAGTIGAAVYVHGLVTKIRFVNPQTTPTLSQEAGDRFLNADSQPASENVPPSMDPEEVDFGELSAQIGSDTLNILLIGQDRREGEERSRSDTMILCSFRKDKKQLILTSFLRDLYVKIPGYRSNRINAAYIFGGMPLLNQTLEDNFGVRVDGNIEVDFSQFAQLIDQLGGVTLELRQDEAEVVSRESGSKLTQGSQHLTGEQALVYARIRDLDADGDFSRTLRQRKLLSALLAAYRNASLPTILGLMDDILPMITTDMEPAYLIRYAMAVFPVLSELQVISQHIPAPGTCEDKTIDGMQVLVADLDEARRLLKETLED